MTPEEKDREKLIDELHTVFLTRWYETPFHRDRVARIFLDWIKANAGEKALVGLIRQLRALKGERREQNPESTTVPAPG